MPEDLNACIRFAILKYREDEWELVNDLQSRYNKNGDMDRDVNILLLLAFGGFQQCEVAQYYGLTQQRVSQILLDMRGVVSCP